MRPRAIPPRFRDVAAVLTAAAALLGVVPARADDSSTRRAVAAHDSARAHTLVEVTTGFIILPGAQICPTGPTTCKNGEFSLPVSIQNLYRFDVFGFGAGITWATTMLRDAATGSPVLQRVHSRAYFLVEAQARYYFIHKRAWDWWAGGTVGLVVVNDSWSVLADRQPYSDADLIGPRAATLGSEGFTIGAIIGGEWTFAPNWSLGPSLHYANWVLPSQRVQSPTLDSASLSGRLDAIDVGIRLGYRISL